LKVVFFDKSLWREFSSLVATSVTAVTTIFSFFEIDKYPKIFILLIFVLVIVFLYKWYSKNEMFFQSFKINNTLIEVKIGDIFNEEGFKVIPFNEYFDTLVDDEIISSNSLNGIFLSDKLHSNEVEEFKSFIEAKKEQSIEKNESRFKGNREKFEIGTMIKYNDFLCFAFSKFDEYNRAYLSYKDYIIFLFKLWSEVDKVYSQRDVCIPLIGSGITRFDNNNIEEEDLLKTILWTFKLSGVKLESSAKIKIIISENKKEKINFYKLKGEY
jgi:hypothetical protein